MRSAFLFTFCLWLSASSCLAQKTYRFESITVEDGLSQSGINSIVQDKFGFLWVGTQDGLNKYDGYSFKVYHHKPDDSTSLPANFIKYVFVDNDGTLWLSVPGKLCRYNPATDRFLSYPIVLPGVVEGDFWINTMFHCRNGSLAICGFTNSPESGAVFYLIDFDPITCKFTVNKLAQNFKFVKAYIETATTGDWAFGDIIMHKPPGSDQWGIEKKRVRFVHYDKITDHVNISTPGDQSSQLDDLLRYNKATERWDLLGRIKVGSPFLETSKDKVIGVVQDRLVLFNRVGNKWDQRQMSSSQMYVSTLYKTRDSVVWIGNNGIGLKKYNPLTNQFSFIGKQENEKISIGHDYVNAIYTDNDSILYVSTFDGLSIINLEKQETTHIKIPSDKLIQTIRKAPEGQLWFCAMDGFYQLRQGKLVKIKSFNGYDLTYNTLLNHIEFLDNKTALIVAGHNVVVNDPYKIDTLATIGSWSDALPLVCGDSIWYTNYSTPLLVFDWRSRKKLFEITDKDNKRRQIVHGPDVKCIFQDSKQRIWIGTNGLGLSLFNKKDKSYDFYTETNGLPNNVVYGILEDSKGNLWLSTNKGLCEFNPETKQLRNFDTQDGLQSNEFNKRAFFKSPSGMMYFGGVNGLTYFNPREIITSSAIPQSIISGFYVNNRLITDYTNYVSVTKEKDRQLFSLRYDERDFGFDVVSIGFSLPGRIRYRYILENYDREWHAIGNLRHISFTNIPPGDYIFKVQSSDPYGNWEANGAIVAVAIRAPFWLNPVLWILAIFAILASSLFIYFWRIRQLKNRARLLERIVDDRTQEIQIQKEEIATQNEELLQQATFLEEKNKELEKAKGLLEIEMKYFHQRQLLKSSIDVQEEERKRIAQDLHDELGAVLSIARMHLVQIQEHQGEEIDLNSGLQQARTLTESALATMRRISHELMPPQLEKFGLIKALQAIAVQTNTTKKITLELIADDDLPRWTMPTELGLYRVCMELINNTLKHAEAKNIRIQLMQHLTSIVFSYSDDGKGLPETYTEGHGFKNIEARVNIMGGTITMENNRSGGFHASLTVPVSVVLSLTQ